MEDEPNMIQTRNKGTLYGLPRGMPNILYWPAMSHCNGKSRCHINQLPANWEACLYQKTTTVGALLARRWIIMTLAGGFDMKPSSAHVRLHWAGLEHTQAHFFQCGRPNPGFSRLIHRCARQPRNNMLFVVLKKPAPRCSLSTLW